MTSGDRTLLVVYTIAIFVGAALVFLIQPMAAKMILPLYGGSPAVWNACMVFFQAGLLGGYAYSHAGPSRLGLRGHALLHIGLLAIPLVLAFAAPGWMMPLSVTDNWAPPTGFPPAVYLILALMLHVGLPFFLIASTTPLVQRWFAATGHVSAKDPYFLYAASNLGSMLALLSYPLLFERTMELAQHAWVWTGGYCALFVLLIVCIGLTWRQMGDATEAGSKEVGGDENSDTQISWSTRLRWTALALVPSSLLLSVTNYLTTDINPMPLLWVLPLALYLLTFILTFARKPPIPHEMIRRLMPLVVLLLAILILSEATEPVSLLVLLHLIGLVVIALLCHGELAESRPSASKLTEFYLWIAVGGVAGGMINALIAPIIFARTGLTEYPVMLVVACLFHRSISIKKWNRDGWREFLLKDALPAVGVGVFAVLLVFGTRAMELPDGPARVGIIFGVPAIVCYVLLERPLRYALCIGALFLAGSFHVGIYGRAEHVTRSFFGVHRITTATLKWKEHPNQTDWYTMKVRKLVHGSTVHGTQSLYPLEKHVPLSYYHADSPIGRLFRTWRGRERNDATNHTAVASAIGTTVWPNFSMSGLGGISELSALTSAKDWLPYPELKRIGIVGLGAGTLAAYAEPREHWTYFEIDSTIVDVARSQFTFLPRAENRLDGNGEMNIVLGDARIELKKYDGEKFDLLVIDAFTSDAVPLHLLTREAMAVYKNRISNRGVIAFHISNRYLDLEPVVNAVAADAGMVCFSSSSSDGSAFEGNNGKSASHWVVVGAKDSPAAGMAHPGIRGGPPWQRLSDPDERYLWTDSRSDLLSVFDWSDQFQFRFFSRSD